MKKLLSLFLAIILCMSSLVLFASAEENTGIPEDDFVEVTLPPCEEVDVTVVYRPITSMISFANFAPFLDGTVLKVTYADGTSEHITITSEKAEDDSLAYVAGDYYVNVNLFNTMEVKSPGINRKSFYILKTANGVQYEGLYRDFTYLYIPSLGEWMFMISNIFKSVFNPIIDFGV